MLECVPVFTQFIKRSTKCLTWSTKNQWKTSGRFYENFAFACLFGFDFLRAVKFSRPLKHFFEWRWAENWSNLSNTVRCSFFQQAQPSCYTFIEITACQRILYIPCSSKKSSIFTKACPTVWTAVRPVQPAHAQWGVDWGTYSLYTCGVAGTDRSAMIFYLRFLVGPYEEFGYTPSESLAEPPNHLRPETKKKIGTAQLKWIQFLNWFQTQVYLVKCGISHPSCPHPYSCSYYVLEVGLIWDYLILFTRDLVIDFTMYVIYVYCNSLQLLFSYLIIFSVNSHLIRRAPAGSFSTVIWHNCASNCLWIQQKLWNRHR